MNILKSAVLALLLAGAPLAHADESPADKAALAKAVWAPVFNQVKYEDAKAQYDKSREQQGKKGPGEFPDLQGFEKSKEIIYEVLADVLTPEDLKLQQRIFSTAVGSRMLGNVPRAMTGLPAQRLTREMFSAPEWREWEKLAFAEKENIAAMEQRMQGFSAALAKRGQALRANNGAR